MALELSLVAASKKSITVKMEIPDDLEVMADRRMFDSLVMNLVSNAVKFTPKGGKINLWAESIPVHTIMISIKDSGIGIKQEMIGRLFNLDEQTSRPGTEGEPSIGLGLIICKDIVEKHGGKIWVVSQPEKGSTFRFTLPAKPPVTDPL
jgi:signal transduction histidine kinase